MPNTEFIFEKQKGVGASKVEHSGAVWKKGKGFVIAATLFAILAAAAFFYVLSPKTAKDGYVLKTWNEATVAKKTIKNIVSSTGVVELISKETVLSPQTAQVSAVYVSEGDSVQKGQSLIRLASDELEWSLVVSKATLDAAIREATMTDTEYDFSIRQQDINIKTAERNLATAKDKLTQTQGLLDRNIASTSELTTAKNTVADASDSLELSRLTREQTIAKHELALTNRVTDLAQKKKAVTDLKESIADCTIRSGSAGRVYTLSAAVGDRVSSYAAVAVIANPSDIQVGIDVAENRINEVKAGNPVSVTIGESVVPATVKSIASSATTSSSSSTSTIRVVAGFTKIPTGAIIGGSVSADIEVGLLEDALTLPRGSYLSSGNYTTAYVIDGSGRASKKTVGFGITDGNVIQVISGLGEGDRVITSAYQDYIHLSEITLSK